MELAWLLGYELRLAVRYRCYVSVVLMASQSGTFKMGQLLKHTLRESDRQFAVNGYDAILMPRTANSEAQRAVDRFKALCNGEVDVRYSVVTYPGDGGTAATMLNKAKRLLAQARQAEFGAVITSG
jgi:hypothetical protein